MVGWTYFGCFSFLATGMGAHLTQTAGLALAADRATDQTQSQVVALLFIYVSTRNGFSSSRIWTFINRFYKFKLIQVVQGAAVVTLFSIWLPSEQENLDQ